MHGIIAAETQGELSVGKELSTAKSRTDIQKIHYSQEQGDDVLDLGELLAVVREGKWRLFSLLLIAMILASVYLYITPSLYQADALLRVDNETALLNNPLQANQSSGGDAQQDYGIPAVIGVIRSRAVLGKIVSDFNMDAGVSPVYFPLVGGAIAHLYSSSGKLAPSLFGLKQYAWGGEEIQLKYFSVPDDYLDTNFTLIAQEGGKYRLLSPKNEFIAEGKVGEPLQHDFGVGQSLSLLITRLRAHDGTRFMLWRNSQLSAISSIAGNLSINEPQKDSGIIELTLKGYNPILITRIVNDIAKTYIHLTAQFASAKADQKVRFLEEQLPILKANLDKSEEALNTYRKENHATDLNVETDVILRQVAQYETQLMQLRQEREELRPTFGEKHPQVIALEARIAQLQKSITSLDSRINNIPSQQQELLRLTRDVDVNKGLYVSLLNSLQEQNIARAGAMGNVRIIDLAVPPTENQQVAPKPFLVVILAMLSGLGTGTAAVFLRHSLHRGTWDPEALEYQSGLPVYATIPHSERQEMLSKGLRRSKLLSPTILASHDPSDPSIESLRGLGVSLHRTISIAENNILMVCSPGQQVGKSFVCANLALILAAAEKRVLVIDADLRNGNLHRNFGLEQSPGLVQLLADGADEGSIGVCIQHTSITGVDVIATGVHTRYPSALLHQKRFGELLNWLSTQYDYLLIDTPPVLVAADAAIIGGHVDAAFMVVRPESTIQEMENCARRLKLAGVDVNGFLLNDVERTSRYGYRHYTKRPAS